MQKIEVLLEKAKAFYDNGDPGHDYAHILRLVESCRVGASYYDPAEPFPQGGALDDKAFTIDHIFHQTFQVARAHERRGREN